MAEGYTEIPHNMEEIAPYVTVDRKLVCAEILEKQGCWFYDACSFRRHANLNRAEAGYLLKYIKSGNGIIIITRCILMELASHSGMINQEYINYIRDIKAFGIDVLVIYEEDLFAVMEAAFGSSSVINGYLCWAVRTIKTPVSTITETLESDSSVYNEIIRGKNLDNRRVYKHFFEAVRANKETGDNLGEELLAVCLHILSNLPGEEDGKFRVITDDKGAAGRIDALFKKTSRQYRGKKIIIFSTPRLVQVLYREKILEDRVHIEEILRTGTDGNIVVLGTRIFDIRNREISLGCEELVDLILQPNGINIVF